MQPTDEADYISETIVEIPVNLYEASRYASGSIPDVDLLYFGGEQPSETTNDVFVMRHKLKVLPTRDWLHERRIPYRMYGRFLWSVSQYRTEREFLGLNFCFATHEGRVIFSLFA